MAWALLLLALSVLHAGAMAQYVLTQPASVSVAPERTVRMDCTRNTGSITSNSIQWYQQKPGAAPKLVIYGYTSRPSDIPTRFTGSYAGSANAAYLTITGAESVDDAMYYCHGWDSNVNAWIFGGGTQLNVLSGETKAPTLSIFPPSTEEIDTNKATLVCQCQDFYPAALAWTWTVNDQTINTGVDSTRPTKQTDNNLFMAGSFLSINAIDWKANNIYTCKATHEGKIFQASVKQSECI